MLNEGGKLKTIKDECIAHFACTARPTPENQK